MFRLNLKRTDTTAHKKKKDKRDFVRRKVKHKMSRPMDISLYKGRDEGGTERKLQREGLREREGSRKGNTVRHEEDEQCVHCPCGLVNILMKESCHKLHTESHND